MNENIPRGLVAEIELRCWDGKVMRLVDQILFLADNAYLLSFFTNGRGVKDPELLFVNHVKHKEAIVMQWTGLKDKSGQKIYDRDIVGCITYNDDDSIDKNYKGLVYYSPTSAAWIVVNLSDRSDDFLGNIDELFVLGNKYQTPQLLNNEQNVQEGRRNEDATTTEADNQNPSQLKEATILSAEEVLKIINTYDKHIEILDKYIKILNDEIEKTKQLLNK